MGVSREKVRRRGKRRMRKKTNLESQTERKADPLVVLGVGSFYVIFGKYKVNSVSNLTV